MNAGFLPTRGSFMLDFVVVAMTLVIPLMAFSIILARRGQRHLHRAIQIVMALVLLVAVAAFEIDLRLITKNWRELAEPSPYYESGWVDRWLWIHLAFAVPTPLWWGWVIFGALRKFPRDLKGSEHVAVHRRRGWIAAVLMTGTAVTGWIFYGVAFVA